MIADRPKLLRDLLVLGVAYGRKLDEADLAVYATLVDRELDDAEWNHAFRRFTSASSDEARFMPTPMRLIDAGCEGRKPEPVAPRALTPEESEWRGRYFARPARPRALGPGSAGHAVLLRNMPAAYQRSLSDEEWESRVATLRAQAARILEGA